VTIRLILDSSAITAYVAGDIRGLGIAELLVTVSEDDNITGLPALCLIEAYRAAHEPEARARLMDLATDDDGHTVMLPLLAGDLPSVADLALDLSTDRAQAAAAAVKHGALLGTYERAAYMKAGVHEDDILDL
jgi:hypothetical protein